MTIDNTKRTVKKPFVSGEEIMALVAFEPNVGGMRGRLGKGTGAIVYYRVGNQEIARCRGVVCDPKTPLQVLHRAIHGSLAKRYAALSSEQMEAWNRLAKRICEGANGFSDGNVYGYTKRNGSAFDNGSQTYQSAFYHGGQAFQSVNTHRCLTGFDAVDDPPEYCRVIAPTKAMSITALSDGRLRLMIEHIVSPGAGYWRLRLTPSLGSGGRRAQLGELRLATLEPAQSYVPILASPQTIELSPRFTYRTGENLGMEIMALSSDFLPGEVLFLRHISIGKD